jgi:two-component system, OmpR family, sensor histidine kinase KdpD
LKEVNRDHRPTPEEFLQRINLEEDRKTHGRLKIFLGYAAGVGKTYSMLAEAHERKADTDVVVGYVETHGRPETDALLSGLESIPPKQISYRGSVFSELDIDAVLKRHPKLVLVDELAHTNIPGARHEKRYQDVEELLESGIDVYSTMNIQHLESQRNVIAQLTDVWVREIVPDSILEIADEIKLVDLPTGDLIKRIKAGKVYLTEKIDSALQDFFREKNLVSLRELTMRIAAGKIDRRTPAISSQYSKENIPIKEKLLVYFSPDNLVHDVLHSARSLASNLDAEWYVVYVETPFSTWLPADKRERLENALRIADRLGAKVVTLHGDSVVRTILDYAYKNEITGIILNGPEGHFWQRWSRQYTVNSFIRHSHEVDIYVISGYKLEKQYKVTSSAKWKWQAYLISFVLIAFATLMSQLVQVLFAPTDIMMIYLLFIALTAVYLGFGPAILASFLSVFAFDFFFVLPYYSVSVYNTQYVFSFIVLFIIGIVISYLTSTLRQQVKIEHQRQAITNALYSLSNELVLKPDIESIARVIKDNVSTKFGLGAIIYIEDETRQKLKAVNNNENNNDVNDYAMAMWSYQHNQESGFGTSTFPQVSTRFMPLSTSNTVKGVMVLSRFDVKHPLRTEQIQSLDAVADLTALAIERAELMAEVQNTRVSKDVEKLQTALLNSISHELKTPLVSIIGVLSGFKEKSVQLSETDRQSLIQNALEQAENLNYLIGNLLNESRIESGALKLVTRITEMKDIIDAAIKQLGDRLYGHKLNVSSGDSTIFVSVDFGLFVQVLVNILDNACKFSPADSEIDIAVATKGKTVLIKVVDRGLGIPPADISRIFDKYYRVQRSMKVPGIGLGLSICKGIVEAHNGTIMAENREGGGTVITIALPEGEVKAVDL